MEQGGFVVRGHAILGMLLLALLPALARGEEAVAEGASEFVMTESLARMLDARDDQGAPVVQEKARSQFDGLPVHAKVLFAEAIDGEFIGTATQLRDILSLGLDSAKLEMVLTNNCVLCHSNPEYQDPPTLFSLDPVAAGSPSYMNLELILSDAHFRHNLSCAGCHGGDPTGEMDHEHPEEWPAEHDERGADPSWIPGFCARCHSDAKLMGRFNPAMPTDQFAKYKESHHGRALLEEGKPGAAQCVSCHGVHGIQSASNPASSVNAKRVPETCGKCHSDAKLMKDVKLDDGSPMPTDQFDEYRKSVHGRALLEEGDTGAPACNDCHGNHAAAPAEVSSVAQICRTCHARNGDLFDGSRHKEAFEEHGWPECETCHGNHAIDKTSDAMLATTKGSLCADCHEEHARDKPECKQTAAHFRETIIGMARVAKSFSSVSRELSERGLDVEPIDDELRSLEDTLALSRSTIHAFERSDFDEVASQGAESTKKIRTLVTAAEEEYEERRRGLLIAIGCLLLVVLALWLKIRGIERDQAGEN